MATWWKVISKFVLFNNISKRINGFWKWPCLVVSHDYSCKFWYSVQLVHMCSGTSSIAVKVFEVFAVFYLCVWDFTYSFLGFLKSCLSL